MTLHTKSWHWNGSLKSLKESLLECAVLNMDLLFPEGLISDKIPEFPEGLFDGILHKSYDMGFQIRDNNLIPCLAIRDKLKWSDLSYFTRKRYLTHFEIGSVCSSDYELRSLSAKINFQEPDYSNALSHIYKMCDTLRCLSISSDWWVPLRLDDLLRNYTGHPHLSLTHLSLKGDWKVFPLRLDPNALKSVHFVSSHLDKSALNAIKTFQNLQDLSFHEVILTDGNNESFMDFLTKGPKDLRRLTLKNVHFQENNDLSDVILSADMVNNLLLNLEHLDWLYTILDDSPFYKNFMVKRKLKVLLVDIANPRSDVTEDFVNQLNVLACKVGNFDTLSGMLAMAEENSFEEDLFYIIYLLRFRLQRPNVQSIGDDELDVMQKIVSLILHKLFSSSFLITLSEVIIALGFHRFPLTLLLRYALCQYRATRPKDIPLTIDILKAFIKRNRNTFLAKRLLKNDLFTGARM